MQRCYGRHNVSRTSVNLFCMALLHSQMQHHMMRNARFGPLTLLMTFRVIDVKSDYKFRRLFYVSDHDAYILG